MNRRGWHDFIKGVMVGACGAMVLGLGLLYLLNMTHVIALSTPALPDIHPFLLWIYNNLRLSLIPFTLTLILYIYSLGRLNQYLKLPHPPPDKVAQTEHLLDIWINLFFGIGVIWTAIGIRNALLTALGDLNPVSAAELGAFTILQRLVDGGILLALSTTIFGAVGGYLLRLNKAITVGARLQTYYRELAKHQSEEFRTILCNIECRLSELANINTRQREEY
ncbi:conserved hypothetical protein [Nitrosococcus halophilus Nc 4]|uniref:MotA/TolQ/ExbB proton channel domain-containing protein n=1 Tax=Nitrosococcus halophilus (strain Nc4) TaxID=472759 RepID=D5C1N6_NITHN|nr:hypothetical protein [Nitrosococcus halophilus]ADE14669.1 conserved hypothetical protein [Nitrosococcus halophilus Nc 4]